MPAVLATEEAQSRRIAVQSQPGQIVHKTLSQKKALYIKRAGRVAQGVGPGFKTQYHKKTNRKSGRIGDAYQILGI
jgi:hypothetical protein